MNTRIHPGKMPAKKAAPVKLHASNLHSRKKHASGGPLKGPAWNTTRSNFASVPATRQVHPAAGAVTKIASREINATAIGETKELLAALKAARQFDGPLSRTTWTPKAFAVLKASLIALTAWAKDNEACEAARLQLKKRRGGRALNKNNSSLIAVHYSSGGKPTDAERKEMSRFAEIVGFAHHQKVNPDDTETWLGPKKQIDILNEAKRLKGRTPSRPVKVASPTIRPNLWKALKAGKGERYNRAIEGLNKLEDRLAASQT